MQCLTQCSLSPREKALKHPKKPFKALTYNQFIIRFVGNIENSALFLLSVQDKYTVMRIECWSYN